MNYEICLKIYLHKHSNKICVELHSMIFGDKLTSFYTELLKRNVSMLSYYFYDKYKEIS